MDKASEVVLSLKPVTFHYKNEPKGTPQYGLIAEQVARVDANLVVRDENGEPISVHYDQVWNMLLNEFLKEHKVFVEEQRKLQNLESTVANLVTTVREQTTQIQKISAQATIQRAESPIVAGQR
jgi:hypothetical protein